MSDEEYTVDDAKAAAERGELDAWVADFLASPGSDNEDLGEWLETFVPCWGGPVELPFDELHRLAGPDDQPTLDDFDDEGYAEIEEMVESLESGWEPPPFVVTHRGDHLKLEDGNHRAEALRQAGRDRYWCVVCFESADQRDEFFADRT